MDGDDIRLVEQLVPRDECGAHFSRAPGREILAPSDHLHTEGVADLGHRTADIAETQDAERPPSHVITDRLLPSAAAQRRVLRDEIAGTAQDECPGQLDRRRRGVARMNDLHAPLCSGLEIDRGVPGPRRGDHAELGQALDDPARHRRALPHHADDVEWLKALDDGVGVREMVVKYRDGRPRIQHRPVRERKSDVLVVVQHGDSEALLFGGHRVSPEGCHPLATRPTGQLPSSMPCRVGRHVQSLGTGNDSPSPSPDRSRRGPERSCAT
jgi:hypothetical protein